MELTFNVPKTDEMVTFVLESATKMLQRLFPSLTTENLKQALTSANKTEEKIAKPLTRTEAKELLSVSLSTVNRYLNQGILKRISLSPRAVRIDPLSVQELLNHGRSNYQPVIK